MDEKGLAPPPSNYCPQLARGGAAAAYSNAQFNTCFPSIHTHTHAAGRYQSTWRRDFDIICANCSVYPRERDTQYIEEEYFSLHRAVIIIIICIRFGGFIYIYIYARLCEHFASFEFYPWEQKGL